VATADAHGVSLSALQKFVAVRKQYRPSENRVFWDLSTPALPFAQPDAPTSAFSEYLTWIKANIASSPI
jgi:hypothetical protein